MMKNTNDQARMATTGDSSDSRTASTVTPTAHTPGPWTFGKTDSSRYITAPNGPPYSLMRDEKYYPWCPYRDEDWRLIAAAPDLLAAVKALLASLNNDLSDEQCAAWDAGRAAIAKAEGR